MSERNVLVSSIAPVSGGVPTMTRFITDVLQSRGWSPVLAHYEPYSVTPELSVPAFQLLQKRPGRQQRTTWGTLETHAFGAWLPELEFTHYRASRMWCELMDRCSRFVAVCGNALAAMPFSDTDRPFTAWVASGWEEDRRDRVQRFPPARKWLDQWVNAPVLRCQERAVLKAGRILALSEYTRTSLDRIAGEPVCHAVLPMPIDSRFFTPDANKVKTFRVGFTGRLDDPRKNIGLMIDAVGKLVEQGVDAKAVLVGGALSADIEARVALRGLSGRIENVGYVTPNELKDLLQSFDVFVLPSHQEGLCISALEAMACGCPVVSTRCGGAEEFVLDDETGYLVDFEALQMADAIQRISGDRNLRSRLSMSARQLVVEHYGSERCEHIFWNAFVQQDHSVREKAI